MKITRRQWLAALPLVGTAVKGAANPRSLGVQLYSLRRVLKTDPAVVLKAIAGIGYKDIEGYSRLDTIALLPRIKDAGLSARSCQTETPLITADWDSYPDFKPVSLNAAIDSLSNSGIEFFKMGYISPGARGDGDDFYRRTADRMNAAAELCRKSGLKFAWQNHAFEFDGRPGQRPIDIFRQRLDPKLVRLELDVFWASIAGYDPIQFLQDWRGRVALVHLNDKTKDTPQQFSESIGQGAYADPGSGALDFPAILKVAGVAGIQYYFAGMDETEGDPVDSLRKSFAYFRMFM